MRFTLRQLEVFLAVARSDSVSQAARQLAMSQSAVSGALADLEAQFEIKLFDRIGKRLELSELGRSIRARAEALHEQARELEGQLTQRSDMGLLRVGATLTIGNYLVVPLMARFVREHAGARVTLHVANTAEIARKLENFELDVALVEGELQQADLAVTRWRDDELVVFCAPQHPFARKRSLTDDDLRRGAWIVREPGSGTRQAFDHAMHGILPELHVELELQHTEAIWPAWVSAVSHAWRLPKSSVTRASYPVASPSAISAGISTSPCTKKSTKAPPSARGSSCAQVAPTASQRWAHREQPWFYAGASVIAPLLNASNR
jgi:DNA-binding transcriptional LysR family regulator